MLAVLLTLVMVFTMMPAAAMAEQTDLIPGQDAETADPVTVRVRVQDGTEFRYINDSLEVPAGIAEEYGFDNGTSEASDQITALDVLVAAHIDKYGDDFLSAKNEEGQNTNGNALLSVDNGNPVEMFGNDNTSKYSGFAINHGYPKDSAGNGYMTNTAPVKDGDVVEFFYYEDPYWGDFLTWFTDMNGNAVDEITIDQGEALNLKLYGFMYMSGYSDYTPYALTQSEEGLLVVQDGNSEKTIDLFNAEEDGSFSVSFEKEGTYCLTAQGYEKTGFSILCPYLTVKVRGKATSFRVNNNSITPEFDKDEHSYELTSPLAAGTSSLSVTWDFSSSMTGKAVYNDVNGTEKTVSLKNQKATSLSNIKAGSTTITFHFYDVFDLENPSASYTLNVKRTPAIKSLSIADSDGKNVQLNQSFSASVTEYSAKVVEGQKISFGTTFNDEKNTVLSVSRNGGGFAAVESGEQYSISSGENTFVIKAVSSDNTTEGTAYTIRIEGVASAESVLKVPEGTILNVYDPSGNLLETDALKTSEAGSDVYRLSDLMENEPYTYRAGKYGFFSEGGTFKGGEDLTIDLKKSDAPQSTLKADWKNFRNSDANNGITSARTARNADEVSLKWVTEETLQTGSGWQIHNPGGYVIVGSGLITNRGNELVKIDTETGKIVQTAAMDDGVGALGCVSLVYGGGFVYVPLSNGKVQAFDAKTLKSVWISESLGTQCTTSLIYDSGYIYGSTGEKAPVAFFCINAADEDPKNEKEVKTATWMIKDETHEKGSYWSTPVTAGDYVIYGTDKGAEAPAIYCRDKKTGALVSKVVLTGLGDQRSSIVYDSGKVFFTTKDGTLCCLTVEQDGNLTDLKTLNQGYTYATGSPVIYDGLIYFSACDNTTPGNKKNHLLIAAQINGQGELEEVCKAVYPTIGYGTVQASALLSTAYVETENAVYLYVTQNTYPGELYVAKHDKTDNSMSIETMMPFTSKYQQYNATSVICDSDGTLYFRNDTGYIFAFEKKIFAGERRTVSFAIKDISGNVLEGANIEISSADNDVQQFTADANGAFSLPAGTYTYTIQKNGYENASGTFTVGRTDLEIPIAMKTGNEISDPEETENVVSITVKGYDGKANYSTQKISYTEGMTALSVLQAVVSNLNWKNTQFGAYVVGIDGLEEFDYGSQSGWMYSVNGVFPNYSAGEYILKAGDNVVWSYTVDLGYDIGNIFVPSDTPVITTGAYGAAVTTAPLAVTVSGTEATAVLTEANEEELLKQAKENKSAEIVLTVSAADVKNADSLKIQLDSSLLKDIYNSTSAKLTVKTPFGEKTYSREELKALSAEAAGNVVTVDFAKNTESDTEAVEKIAEGVQATKLTARSEKTSKGIKITWTKSKGYKVDYYEVFRSTKRYSGYGKAAFYTTKNAENPAKTWYVNTKDLKAGTRYYYKVRGVRMLDGSKVYTQWSAKAWRIA